MKDQKSPEELKSKKCTHETFDKLQEFFDKEIQCLYHKIGKVKQKKESLEEARKRILKD